MVYQAVSPTDYRALGFPETEGQGNMLQFMRVFEAEFCAARDPTVTSAPNG